MQCSHSSNLMTDNILKSKSPDSSNIRANCNTYKNVISKETFNAKSLSIFYQNARGLNTKTNLLYHSISVCDFDIIGISETWLKEDVSSSELFPSNFVVFRKDRDFEILNKSRGGGVLLGVKQYLLCEN